MGRVFAPLDEELGLLPGCYSPYVHESVVRLGTWLSFEQVPDAVAWFTQVQVGRETARRLTEQAGAALVEAETAAVERLEQQGPAATAAPVGRYQVSVDGAMVPLVGGAWAEVKTLALGQVEPRAGEPHTTALSYFSRLADVDTFCRLAQGELYRRGIPFARDVCAVGDGAEWCQTFRSRCCPHALPILDFPHAGEYLSAVSHAMWGVGTPESDCWLATQLHALKHDGPPRVFAALDALPVAESLTPLAAAEKQATAVQYLTTRLAQIQYPTFRAAGYPIGSGVVESANKLVVEARLKGSGRHWARPNVNPMVALRAAACSHRWLLAWTALVQQRQADRRQWREQRVAQRRPPLAPGPEPSPHLLPPRAQAAVARLPFGRSRAGRPSPDHPWRKPFFRRSPTQPALANS